MYRDFASVYDRLSSDIDYDKYGENILDLVQREGVKRDSLLELACGTGRLTEKIAPAFREVTCLDQSEEMLAVLSGKDFAENIKLISYDMVDYEDPFSYDLIVVLLDSINYILEEEDLERLLENSYKNLKEGGLLIFDLNSPYKMEEVFGDETYVYEDEEVFYVWENEKDGDLVSMEINFFLKEEDGSYRRIIEDQTERVYSPEKVLKLLEEKGFKEIESFDEDSFEEVGEDTLRILFMAKKEGNSWKEL